MYCSKHLTGRPGLLLLGVLLAVLLLSGSVSFAQTADPNSSVNTTPKEHKWGVSFDGFLMSGTFTPALLPQSEPYSNSMTDMADPYGFGLSIDYNFSPKIRLFFDGNFYTYRKQVGAVGEYSTSNWVFEMNDYDTHFIGPFTEDAYCYMETVGLRVGVKYGFEKNGFRPWVGAGIGIYSWKNSYVTADRTGSWGEDKGTVAGPTYLLGVDWILDRSSSKPMFVSLFADLTSPVVYPKIDNLFQDGWTWENVGGAHVMGPYRFGLSVGFLL